MRLLPQVGLAIVLATLSGCSYRLHAKMEGSLSSPTITLSDSMFIKRPLCLTGLTLVSMQQPIRVAWSIKAKGSDCVPISELTYGQTPSKFYEEVPAETLKAGVIYGLSRGASGPTPRTLHDAEFRFARDRWERLD